MPDGSKGVRCTMPTDLLGTPGDRPAQRNGELSPARGANLQQESDARQKGEPSGAPGGSKGGRCPMPTDLLGVG